MQPCKRMLAERGSVSISSTMMMEAEIVFETLDSNCIFAWLINREDLIG
jgi:hypothetical protein